MVFAFKFAGGRITGIDLIADAGRLEKMQID